MRPPAPPLLAPLTPDGGAARHTDRVYLPASDGHWKRVQPYVEPEPDPEYRQASESAREAFREIKFAVRIHWGLYSIWHEGPESWPFLKWPAEKRQRYQELYRTWNPAGFDADEWMRLFRRCGLQCFAFTTKHHDGFSLYDTHTRVARRVNWTTEGGPQIEPCDLAYSIMETPFRRDVVRELCEAARKHDVKIDLYFSHPDWYDADFRPFVDHPLKDRVNRAQHPDHWAHFVSRHREQLTELLTRYGPIDMVCLDMWLDETAWPDLRETMKALRKLQPNVMFRARGIGNYGDYYTPEGFVPGAKENTRMPWMVIYPLGRHFSYEPDAHEHKGGPWIVRNLVDAVAKGGSFMVGVGPDGDGRFHPTAVEQMEFAGAWLRVNGEAIYGTRPREGDLWRDGEHVRFTRARDGRMVYALCLEWPGRELTLTSTRARAGTKVSMPGVSEPLAWHAEGERGMRIAIPDGLQDEARRPSRAVSVFKIEVEA
jgi:alpha-L-fucosidase